IEEDPVPKARKKTVWKKSKKTVTNTVQEEEEEIEEETQDLPTGSLNAAMVTAIQGLLQQNMGGFQAQLDTLQKQGGEVISLSSAKESSSSDDDGGKNRSSDIDYNSPAPPPKRI
ncbi:hypothetical protein EJ02DRAFT_426168, partial [Clathrospora elynae]